MATGIVFGRVRPTTAELRKMVAIVHLIQYLPAYKNLFFQI